MSLLDKICQALIKMIRKKTEYKKLWSNASSTSAFGGQTLTVTGISNYPYYGILVNNTGEFIAPKGKSVVLSGNDANSFWRRNVSVSGDKLTISAVKGLIYTAGTHSDRTDGTLLVPVEIYGIKKLGRVLRNLLQSFAGRCCVCLAY